MRGFVSVASGERTNTLVRLIKNLPEFYHQLRPKQMSKWGATAPQTLG